MLSPQDGKYNIYSLPSLSHVTVILNEMGKKLPGRPPNWSAFPACCHLRVLWRTELLLGVGQNSSDTSYHHWGTPFFTGARGGSQPLVGLLLFPFYHASILWGWERNQKKTFVSIFLRSSSSFSCHTPKSVSSYFPLALGQTVPAPNGFSMDFVKMN